GTGGMVRESASAATAVAARAEAPDNGSARRAAGHGSSAVDYQDIRTERRGEVEILTLDRPDARNALTHRTYAELERAVRETTARCLVITGAGTAFCSGDDVRQVMGGGDGKAGERLAAAAPRLTPAAEALLTSDVPVVAAVNGPAVGWGME